MQFIIYFSIISILMHSFFSIFSSPSILPLDYNQQGQGEVGWVEEGTMVVSRQYFSLNAVGNSLFAIGPVKTIQYNLMK